MSQTDSDRNPVDELAEEFVERYRRGERPSLTEYTSRYPQLAEQIRGLFPALLLMEDARPASHEVTGRNLSPKSTRVLNLERIGDFRILREVGRGGMGIVFEAEQESLGRHVALKVLPAQTLLDPNKVQRFQREARAAAKLHHTNIVPVYGVGEDNGLHYYVMQFIQGQGLDQVLEELGRLRNTRGLTQAIPCCSTGASSAAAVAQAMLTGIYQVSKSPASGDEVLTKSAPHTCVSSSDSSISLPGQATHSTLSDTGRAYWQSVARVGIQVAEALSYAHGQGTLHRDIKPSNLLLDSQGIVWVTDFGLAKATAETENLTHTGDIVGTLRYMAPERFQGHSDARSDICALGLTLYELSTLRPAYRGSDRNKLIQQVLHEEPSRPRKINPAIPHDLETIVLKAIDRDPAHRYATAADMAADLKRFVEDRPICARRSSYAERWWRWCRRNPAVASLLAMLFVVFITAFAVVTVKWREAEAAELRASEDRNLALAAERTARLREAEALVGQAHGTRLSRRPGQRFEALEALGKAAALGRELGQPPEWFDRLRNEAIAALALPDLHIAREFGSFPPGSRWVELNDDFTLYVHTTNMGDCTIRRVDDDTEIAQLPNLGEPVEAQFGSGTILAVRTYKSNRFQLWNLSGMKPIPQLEVLGIANWGFRNDGRLLALIHADGSISVHETVSGKPMYTLAPGQIVRGVILQLHPTAPFIACSSYWFNQGVHVRDLRSGAVVATAVPHWKHGSGAYWGPDGRTLLVEEADGGIIQEYAFDPAAPALRLTRNIEGPLVGGVGLVFNPAGDRFVRRGWANRVLLFDAVSGQELFRTPSLPTASRYNLLRFDPTGQRLAGARVGDRIDRIGLWSVADAREYRSLVHPGSAEWISGEYRPAIHPGGRLAAMPLNDGVALFDLDSGRELAHLPISPRGSSVHFDGTGNLLSNGFVGLLRWPVRQDSATPGRLLIGPPERLLFNPGRGHISANHDGRVIAQCMWAGYDEQAFAGGWILHPNSPTPRWVDPGASMGCCTVSPDGRWVAFRRHELESGFPVINVYEAATAQRVWQSPEGNHGRFSPDGRWLATDTDGGRLYAVGTWQPGPQLGPGTPWDMTSELAVLGESNGIYRLVELATGRELARLEDPEQNNIAAALTPDGTKLVVAARKGLRVWDLHRIRAELTKLDLDWEAPPLPTTTASVEAPLSIHVEMGDMFSRPPEHSLVEQANQHIRSKEYATALAELRQAIKIAPKYARAHNNLAWLLLTGPRELRDPAQALPLARKAVELEPKKPVFVNTLGVALYRVGQFAEAIPFLERSLLERKGQTDAFDLFFLAMCHHRLGDAARAKDCLERGKQWAGKHKGQLPANFVEELTAFQAEADDVLAKPPQ
jgi:serine/threonine protein kinase/WD40 repeat protein